MKIHIRGAASAFFGALVLTLTSVAQTTIEVDFDSTDMVELSCGDMFQATPSGLTAMERMDVLGKMQAKFNAVAKEKFVVKEPDARFAGSAPLLRGNTIKMIVSGSSDPRFYGDAGKPGEPGVVARGGLVEDGLTGDDLCKGTAGVTAHEAGHKLGLDHNCDSPPSCMTKGEDNDPTSGAGFNDDDKMKLMENCEEEDSEGKDGSSGSDVGTGTGDSSANFLARGISSRPLDRGLDSTATYISGPASGVAFGYLSGSGSFVFKGDSCNVAGNETVITFLYDAGADIAVRDTFGLIYSLSAGDATYTLAKPSLTDPNVFRATQITFATLMGPVVIELDASDFTELPGAGFFDFPGNGVHSWADMGASLAGASGTINFVGVGSMAPGATNQLFASGAPANAAGFLIVGGAYLGQPAAGGILIPSPDIVQPITFDANGVFSFSFPSLNFPAGTRLWYQIGVPDSTVPGGFSISNGLRSTNN